MAPKRFPINEINNDTPCRRGFYVAGKVLNGDPERLGGKPLCENSSTTRPIVDLTLRNLFGQPVFLLNLANQLVPLSGNLIKIVIGQFAPLLEDLALNLLPFAFDLIPVHCNSPC